MGYKVNKRYIYQSGQEKQVRPAGRQYSIDFRNRTLQSILNEGWTVKEGTFDSSFGANGLHGTGSWNVLKKDIDVKLTNKSIIKCETSIIVGNSSWEQGNVELNIPDSNGVFLSIYYNGSQDRYRFKVGSTTYGQYVSHSSGTKLCSCNANLGDKTYTATIGSLTLSGSLSDTDINNIINKSLHLAATPKWEYIPYLKWEITS